MVVPSIVFKAGSGTWNPLNTNHWTVEQKISKKLDFSELKSFITIVFVHFAYRASPDPDSMDTRNYFQFYWQWAEWQLMEIILEYSEFTATGCYRLVKTERHQFRNTSYIICLAHPSYELQNSRLILVPCILITNWLLEQETYINY